MNLVILGKGKTGSLVADVARERNHQVRAYDEFDNVHGSALTAENLRGTDLVIDFTAPSAVVENITACAKAGVNMVVGTTGWYDGIPQIRKIVEDAGTGFLYGANFSVGVNLFFEIARTASMALKLGYSAKVMERHHVSKKDAPSGTAIKLANVVTEGVSTAELPIESQRLGDDHSQPRSEIAARLCPRRYPRCRMAQRQARLLRL
jgi:4-hydroxy-tetrahydrodipicolinate reductase